MQKYLKYMKWESKKPQNIFKYIWVEKNFIWWFVFWGFWVSWVPAMLYAFYVWFVIEIEWI
jgi:hypothetical protein